MKRTPIKARPTTYKGIQMRSRLEADYAAALDRDGEKWEYEPTCFAGPEGQWLPDFKIGFDGVYIEIKPVYLIAYDGATPLDTYDRVDKILRQMSVAWLSEPNAPLQLIFWDYGREQIEAPLAILGTPHPVTWVCYTPSTLDLPLLWPGMGQMDAAVKSASPSGTPHD